MPRGRVIPALDGEWNRSVGIQTQPVKKRYSSLINLPVLGARITELVTR